VAVFGLFSALHCAPYCKTVNHNNLKNLLLIDDDEDDRDFFLSVLSTISPAYSCETAENGLIALNGLVAHKYAPDLIFLDLNMPVMSGKQFLQEIKANAELNHIPVIILSTSADRQSIAETRSMGAIEFITKPSKLSVLEIKLREVLSNPSFRTN